MESSASRLLSYTDDCDSRGAGHPLLCKEPVSMRGGCRNGRDCELLPVLSGRSSPINLDLRSGETTR